MNCKICGSEIKDSSKFCCVCGSRVIDTGEPSEVPANFVSEADTGVALESAPLVGGVPPADEGEEPEQASDIESVRQAPVAVSSSPPYSIGTEPPPFLNDDKEICRAKSRITVARDERAKSLTTGQYWLIEIVSVIPIVGFIVLCAWALSHKVNPNRTRLAQAKLMVRFVVYLVSLLSAIAFFIWVFIVHGSMEGWLESLKSEGFVR